MVGLARIGIAVIAAGLFVLASPASAANTALLSCKCEVAFGGKPNTCDSLDNFSVSVDFDNATAQLIFPGKTFDPVPVGISVTMLRIETTSEIHDGSKTTIVPRHFFIDRIDGTYTQQVELGPGIVSSGICTKVDAPRF